MKIFNIIAFAVLLTVCNFAMRDETKPMRAVQEDFITNDPCDNFVSSADYTCDADKEFIPPTVEELNFANEGDQN